MTAVDREIELAAAHIVRGTARPTAPPYPIGDRVQILYMTEPGTSLSAAHLEACFGRVDGSYGVNHVISDARATLQLTSIDQPTLRIETALKDRRGNKVRRGHVIYGVYHTKPTE